jgi:hypothetical protein
LPIFIAISFVAHAPTLLTDIPRMNPWNGVNASILSGFGEAMGGLRSFSAASAVPDVSNDL